MGYVSGAVNMVYELSVFRGEYIRIIVGVGVVVDWRSSCFVRRVVVVVMNEMRLDGTIHTITWSHARSIITERSNTKQKATDLRGNLVGH